MTISDIIALLALLIALFSLWLSYRSMSLNKQLVAAEKRTHTHNVLFGVLLEAEELHSLIRNGLECKGVELPAGVEIIETQLSDMINNLKERLAWLQAKNSDDPLLLEEYKAHALKVEAILKQVGPRIKGLEVHVNTDS